MFKGKAVDMEQIANDLGVAYLVHGSVRKSGSKVRITAQLIEGASGGHLWADRYDRNLTDIFALQDEITRTVVDQLKVVGQAAGTYGAKVLLGGYNAEEVSGKDVPADFVAHSVYEALSFVKDAFHLRPGPKKALPA